MPDSPNRVAGQGTNSQQFKISRAIISADRFGDDFSIDVGNIIAEINIFEDINKPYITGSLVLVDDSSILDYINFRGTEYLDLELEGVDNDSTPTMTKIFRITGIEKSVRTNDRTEVFVLTMIDQAGFNTHVNRISKSYTGKVEDIISAIVSSELGVGIDRSYAGPSIQAPMKIVIPYLHPLQAVSWLCDRITRSNGTPYYAYASVHDDNIRIGDLSTMLSVRAFNSSLPYHYSASTINAAERAGAAPEGSKELDRAFTVSTVTKERIENTLDMIKAGAIGSTYSNTDIGGGLTLSSKHEIESTLGQLQVSNVIQEHQTQNVFDYKNTINRGPRGVDLPSNYSSRFFHEISSSKTYDDANGYGDDVEDTGVLNKARAKSIHSMLQRNKINIEIPGTGFMLRKVSVGDTVSINFLNGEVSDKPKALDDILDKNRSGDYLILATRHLFRNTSHTVALSISKIVRGTINNE